LQLDAWTRSLPRYYDLITVAFETKELRAAADVLGVRLLIVNAALPNEIEMAFATLARQQVGALLVSTDALFLNHNDHLVALAARHALPTMYWSPRAARAGGLMNYSTDFADLNRRIIGAYVGRILKGEKPADLPVQQPIKFELVINMKTANALGLTVPRSLLGRADEVIE